MKQMMKKMKKSMAGQVLWLFMLVLVVAQGLSACRSDSQDAPNPDPVQTVNHRTLLMYFPWSGDSSPLTTFFWQNIRDMKRAYLQSGVKDEQVIVFIQTDGTTGYLFNLANYRGFAKDSLATYTQYTDLAPTTVGGIARILGAMRAMAPADSGYAMTIGCHGLGWIPVTPASRHQAASVSAAGSAPHWDSFRPGGAVTRFFGGTSARYQTDITTLADAIASTGMQMDYILFDDCYMSSVEVAYDLRQVARYVIACPTEVMGDGMPYAEIGKSLLGRPDYQGVVDGFLRHYEAASFPYGTIGVTCCAELDGLARLMREIHQRDSVWTGDRSALQRMDGYTPVLFYDLGDYVDHLCSDSLLRQQFAAQLGRVVPYKAHTAKFPTVMSSSAAEYVGDGLYVVPIHTYSGITTSEPSVHQSANLYYRSTAWYQATCP